MLKFENITYTYHTKEGETTAVKDLTFRSEEHTSELQSPS